MTLLHVDFGHQVHQRPYEEYLRLIQRAEAIHHKSLLREPDNRSVNIVHSSVHCPS